MSLDFRVGFNHPDERAAYLAGLNRCFPGWGDATRFAWCFERRADGLNPDALWMADSAGRPVAGIALVYRRSTLNGGRAARIAMYSGAWTLPEARGAGAYAHLIDAGRAVAAQQNAVAIVSFVTADNPSGRGLTRLGALMTPSYYGRSTAAVGSPHPDVAPTPLSALQPDAFPAPVGASCLVYEPSEWRAQFLARPGALEAVGRDGHWVALIERTAAFDRLLALSAAPAERVDAIAALAARAAATSRQLFLFDTDPVTAAALRTRGFEWSGGFVCVLPTTAWPDTHTCPTNWFFHNGDRM